MYSLVFRVYLFIYIFIIIYLDETQDQDTSTPSLECLSTQNDKQKNRVDRILRRRQICRAKEDFRPPKQVVVNNIDNKYEVHVIKIITFLIFQ